MKDRARTLVEQSVHALATGKGKEYITIIKGECAWARLVRNQSECLSWTTTNSFE